ncbi:MAG: hypothetical protein CTY38_00940 [Methylotenera sp.]|uniref:hypothetical protein n=1 Tax=Methylotenera sp. TaxID=2051956 RepID=UPI000D46D264|nr:hypothetical protein [Methylotenera sp.]PPC84644.1 MAG: hypothetical protein CTY38_00940 [Methylotenera sp.]
MLRKVTAPEKVFVFGEECDPAPNDHKVHDILEAMPEDELDAEIEKLEAVTDTDEFSGGQDEARLSFVFAHKEVFIEYVR